MQESNNPIQSVAELRRITAAARTMAEELLECMDEQAERYPDEKWHRPKTMALAAVSSLLAAQEELLERGFDTPNTPRTYRNGPPATYRGSTTPEGRQVEVTLRDGTKAELPSGPRIYRRQPRTFDWGNTSAESQHLALSVLHHTGAADPIREGITSAFHNEVVLRLPDEWMISEDQVWEWASDHPGV